MTEYPEIKTFFIEHKNSILLKIYILAVRRVKEYYEVHRVMKITNNLEMRLDRRGK